MPGGFIGFLMERGKEQEQDEKNRSRGFTSLVGYLDAAGLMPKEVAMTKSYDELQGIAKGFAVKAALAEQQQKEAAAAQIGPALGYLAKQTAPSVTPDDIGSYYDKTYTEPGGDRIYPTGAPPMTREQATAEMFTRYPQAVNAPNFDNVLHLMDTYGKSDVETVPKEKQFGDLRVIYNPKGGNFQLDPKYGLDLRTAADEIKNAPKDPGEPPADDPPKGFVWRFNGRQWAQERAPSGGDITPRDKYTALQTQKRELQRQRAAVQFSPKLTEAYDNELAGLDQQLSALDGTGTPIKPMTPDVQPMPKSKAELKAGMIYQTARGPAKWNGQQFVIGQ